MNAFGHYPDPDPRTVACRACGRTLEPFGDASWRHARPRCGAAMRYGEKCARYAGHSQDSHGKGHRTRSALDYQSWVHNGRTPRTAP